MATLTNQQINLTYPGLIKLDDNGAVQPTALKTLTDGTGGTLPIQVSQIETKFTSGSLVDFTGTTITGISAGGLVAGTGSNSMRSADSLTATAAQATGGDSIALGNGANAYGNGIAIGVGTTAGPSGPTVCIGRYAQANGSVTMALGNGANVNADQAIGISGEVISVSGGRSIGIGRQVTVSSGNSIGIGNYAKVTGGSSMSFTSCSVNVNDQKAANSLMMVPGQYGCTTNTGAIHSVVLGSASSQLERASNTGSISIGYNTQSTADNAVALGASVIANRADTTSVTELEVQSTGGGIVLYSPNGTGYKLTVSDAGAAVFTAI